MEIGKWFEFMDFWIESRLRVRHVAGEFQFQFQCEFQFQCSELWLEIVVGLWPMRISLSVFRVVFFYQFRFAKFQCSCIFVSMGLWRWSCVWTNNIEHLLLSFFFWPLLILGGLFALTCPSKLVHRSELCCGMKQMAACCGGMKQMAAYCGGMKQIAACRGMNRRKAAWTKLRKLWNWKSRSRGMNRRKTTWTKLRKLWTWKSRSRGMSRRKALRGMGHQAASPSTCPCRIMTAVSRVPPACTCPHGAMHHKSNKKPQQRLYKFLMTHILFTKKST